VVQPYIKLLLSFFFFFILFFSKKKNLKKICLLVHTDFRMAHYAATISSASLNEARQQARLLFKRIMREVPRAIQLFNLPVSEDVVKRRVRQEFRKHAHLTDVDAIDVLLFRGRNELEEVRNMWKQKPHLMRFLRGSDNSQNYRFHANITSGPAIAASSAAVQGSAAAGHAFLDALFEDHDEFTDRLLEN
jgi:NADH dehydrogenase (ubiquinone) 1 alpha subcomplex subunit 6